MKAQTEITAYIEKNITGKITPGFQYLVIDSMGIVYEYNGGYADIAMQSPVTANTEFKLYSSTKTLTALAIHQLIEQGKLKPDDSIGEILGIDFGQRVTIQQALSHTGGLSSAPFISETHSASEHDNFDVKTNTEKLTIENKKLRSTPGKKKKYSNYGFLLLGKVIEKVSGQEYTSYIEKQIFNKMDSTNKMSFSFNNNTAKGYQLTGNLIHFIYSRFKFIRKYYLGKEGKFMKFDDLYLNAYSYGGGFGNARSLGNYAHTLIKKDGPLLSDEQKKELFREQKLSNGKSARQTQGWFIGDLNGHTYYCHPGGGGGYSCELRIYPEKGMVTVYMMNTTQLFSHLKLLSKLDDYFID